MLDGISKVTNGKIWAKWDNWSTLVPAKMQKHRHDSYFLYSFLTWKQGLVMFGLR